MKKIKILVISNTAWSYDNSFGMTYSALFEGMPDITIANIYCNYGVPDNSCVKQYFQITEKSIIKNLKDKNSPSGAAFSAENAARAAISLNKQDGNIHNNLKKIRFQLVMWGRDIIWFFSRWKSPALKKFVTDFAPDVIFTPVYYMFHTNRILRYVRELTKVPTLCYISDDIYTMKQFSYSPLFWIDRILKRKSIRGAVKNCRCIYTVCDAQSEEYSKAFKVPCKILFKPADGERYISRKNECSEKPMQTHRKKVFVYAGNLGTDRWRTLAAVGREVSLRKGVLKVYSATAVSRRIRKIFLKSGIEFMGKVSPEEAARARIEADVLVFAEGFSKKAFGKTRFSLSTKIPDYLTSGKTVLAAGCKGIASIEYLRNENAAIIADSLDAIGECVEFCMRAKKQYSKNAMFCAERDFNRKTIQKNLRHDIELATFGEGV